MKHFPESDLRLARLLALIFFSFQCMGVTAAQSPTPSGREIPARIPMPAAIAPATPTVDLTKTGDTLFTNAMVDNVLLTQDGFIRATAFLYANGRDLRDPLLSPIYGDVVGFPPTILTSGTRDLYLSNTVRMHRKLRAAGVEAVLQVWEGQSHTQYLADPTAPETKEYHDEVALFLAKHLGRK